MIGCMAILSALPSFFLSAFVIMIFWGIVSPWVGVATLSYWNSLLVTFCLWVALAPLAVSVGKMMSGSR